MNLITALINKGYTLEQSEEIVSEMRKRIMNGCEDPEELLFEEGLEPDYVFDLITF